MGKRKGRKIGMIDEWSDLHPVLPPLSKDFLPKNRILSYFIRVCPKTTCGNSSGCFLGRE
jgi:hypothetical protein